MNTIRLNYLKESFFVLAIFVFNFGYGQQGFVASQLQVGLIESCQIECNPLPDTIYCNESFENLSTPSVTDCAQSYSIQLLSEIYVDDNFCDDNMKKVERRWQALDGAGNELSSCTQTVVINKLDASFPKDIVWTSEQYNFNFNIIDPTPIHEYIFDLDEYDGENDIDVDPGLSDFVVQNSGSGFPKGAEDASCLYDVSYHDSIVLGCKQSFQVLRKWTVVDQCWGSTVSQVQKISVNDKSSNVNLESSPGYVLNGMHYEYHVIASNDLCKSEDFILFPKFFDGVDTTSIVVSTPLGALVNLTATGGFIPAPGLNVGKYTDGLKIVMNDSCGNTETLLVTLVVDAMDEPQCAAPENVMVSCADFNPSLSVYGSLNATNNCGTPIDSTSSSVDWAGYDTLCQTGTITRYWSVWDIDGNTGSCLQKITIVPPLTYTIQFPDDVLDGSADTIAPTFTGSCSPASWQVSDVKVIPAGQCLGKIYRTYTTFNDCDVDPNFQPELVVNPENTINGAYGTATPQNHGVLSYTLIIENFCDTRTVSGAIHLVSGEGIVHVTVTAKSSDLSKPTFSTLTDKYGNYSLQLPIASDYIIKPEKLDDTHKNGVDVGDAMILYKHILIIPEITSPYKILAANVLGENSAKINELLEIQKLALNKIDEFDDVPVWTFAETSVKFLKPLQPYDVHYSNHLISKLQENQALKFYGIKYGDLDNSVNLLPNSSITSFDRTNDMAQITLDDIYLEEGKEYQIPFELLSDKNILSYQFALDFDEKSLEYLELEVDDEQLNDDFNLENIKDGQLATAHVGEVIQDKPIFIIRFKVKRSGFLSQMIDVADDIIPSKAFDEELNLMGLQMNYRPSDSRPTLRLFQNDPNPFMDLTTIKFDLQKEEKVSLTIYSTEGQVVTRREKLYPSGLHQEIFSGEIFQDQGIYFYRIETADQVIVKKMIKI